MEPLNFVPKKVKSKRKVPQKLSNQSKIFQGKSNSEFTPHAFADMQSNKFFLRKGGPFGVGLDAYGLERA